MELPVRGEVVHWRGPAPYHFVALPDAEAERLRAVASRVTYGWGCIPATVTLGRTTFATSIFPRDGGFMVPLKVAARRAEGVELGDDVELLVVVADPDVVDAGGPATPGSESTEHPRGGAGDGDATVVRPTGRRAARHDPADDDDYYDPAADPAPR